MSVSTVTPSRKFGNAAEWWQALGEIPLERIVMDPLPGTATEQDLLWHVERDKLVELVDGTLVEKTVGWIESLIATKLSRIIGNFVEERRLGVVAGADATLKMSGGNIRLPDINFVSFSEMPSGKVPTESVPKLTPTLAIEVISEGNTKAEMRRKLREYFSSGTKLVWMLYPKTKTIAVYEQPTDDPTRILSETGTLDGGDVLPGFSLPVTELFRQ